MIFLTVLCNLWCISLACKLLQRAVRNAEDYIQKLFLMASTFHFSCQFPLHIPCLRKKQSQETREQWSATNNYCGTCHMKWTSFETPIIIWVRLRFSGEKSADSSRSETFNFCFFVCVHLRAHENESENASWSPKKVIQHQKSHQHFTVFTGLASGRKTEGVTKKLRAFSRKVIGKPEIARFIGLGDPRRRLWEPLNPRPN